MGKFVRYEPCPRCTNEGRDRAGDNLGVYDDGSTHCFSCGFHRHPTHWTPPSEVKENGRSSQEGALPRDFTREIPAAAWKWLLQWGLPYSYWKPYCGYSESASRLIFPVEGRFSVGRLINRGNDGGAQGTSSDARSIGGSSSDEEVRLPWLRNKQDVRLPNERKWYVYGDRSGVVPILGKKEKHPAKVVLVEDLISAHKVAQVNPCIPLFGTNIRDEDIKALQALKTPVVLWLDADQYSLLPKKINRLQALLDVPVGYVYTEQDPKRYSIEEIKEKLK